MTLMAQWAVHAYGTELLPFGPTDAEMVYMPDYCKAKSAGPSSPEFQAWAARVGSKYERIWGGMHHYCAGLNNMNRYLRLVNHPKRGYILSRAVGEMNYNLTKEFPDDFLLAGDMYLNRGLAYQLMHKDGEAAADFYKAITIDPTKVQGYLGLADIYLKGNKKNKALEIVSSGLKNVPANKALQRRYLALGGKEPFPVALEQTSVAADKEKNTHTSSSKPTIAADLKPDISLNEQKPAATSETADPKKDYKEGIDAVKIQVDNKPSTTNSQKNPYCRFCP
jgi:tetratricopeptide (TPR) repeat protein